MDFDEEKNTLYNQQTILWMWYIVCFVADKNQIYEVFNERSLSSIMLAPIWSHFKTQKFVAEYNCRKLKGAVPGCY